MVAKYEKLLKIPKELFRLGHIVVQLNVGVEARPRI